MTSMENQTQIACMVAQWFTHYATAAFDFNSSYLNKLSDNISKEQNFIFLLRDFNVI